MVRKFPPPRKIVDPDNPPTLTPRQLQIMRFIRDYRASRGYSPTMDELAAHMDVSKVTVFEHVGALEHKGLLKRTPHKARSLQISKLMSWPPDEDAVAPVPKPFEFLLAGRIAAGRPIEAIEDRETLDLASMFDTRYGTYVLRVSGQSMIDDHICDGDFVIVERRTAARDGETVVALLEDGHATLKRFYRQGGAHPPATCERADGANICGPGGNPGRCDWGVASVLMPAGRRGFWHHQDNGRPRRMKRLPIQMSITVKAN